MSLTPSISADGRYVAFTSRASNLVPGDTNMAADVFVRDRQTGTCERVSVDSNGSQASANSGESDVSADGRYVAFVSSAANLVPGDSNFNDDVFVRDRSTGTTELVSVDSSGLQANGRSEWPSISADGRYVAFVSVATNLVSGGTNGHRQVFVRDRQLGTTELVSSDSNGTQGNDESFDSTPPSISADGRYVAFDSYATNLVPGDTNGTFDVFVRDRQGGITVRVSVDSMGIQANGSSDAHSLSADGRYVAFESFATNLVPGDTNGFCDVFVHDRLNGTTERVSIDSNGVQGNGDCYASCISADARFVAFVGYYASNLVAGDTNGAPDVFVRDRQNGTTERVSVDSNGVQGNSGSDDAWISTEGRYVSFISAATNFVPGDTNMAADVFVRDRGPGYSSTGHAFCSGDGTGTVCPCGNNGTAGNGCANSVNSNGANLAASGTTSVSADTLVLHGTGMPSSSALYFQGTSQTSAVFGDGLRCAAGTVVRLRIKSNAGGASQFPDTGDPSVSSAGLVPAAGGVRDYQCWYRNSDPTFCTSATFNLTNGLQINWSP